jgi:hypothetical protein
MALPLHKLGMLDADATTTVPDIGAAGVPARARHGCAGEV